MCAAVASRRLTVFPSADAGAANLAPKETPHVEPIAQRRRRRCGNATNTAINAIRTLALVGPAAAGKTSLAEALLHRAGAIAAPGSLERGTTVSDHDPLERRMQHSLNASVMHLQHAGTRVHFIDTPGAPDFLGQSLPALEAVETAAIVINALTGIEPMALRMMDYAAQRQLDRMIIVNKIDAPGVNLQALLAQIQATFGKECLPLNLPAGGGTQGGRLLLQPRRRSDFSSVDERPPRAGRAGGRGRCRLRRPLPERRRRRRQPSCTRRSNRRCAKAT